MLNGNRHSDVFLEAMTLMRSDWEQPVTERTRLVKHNTVEREEAGRLKTSMIF